MVFGICVLKQNKKYVSHRLFYWTLFECTALYDLKQWNIVPFWWLEIFHAVPFRGISLPTVGSDIRRNATAWFWYCWFMFPKQKICQSSFILLTVFWMHNVIWLKTMKYWTFLRTWNFCAVPFRGISLPTVGSDIRRNATTWFWYCWFMFPKQKICQS